MPKADRSAVVIAFGEFFRDPGRDQPFGFAPERGVHDIHTMQGNSGSFADDNRINGDGALFTRFTGGETVALFVRFSVQSTTTDDRGTRASCTADWWEPRERGQGGHRRYISPTEPPERSVSETERPQSPFAGKFDFSARPPVRTLSPDEIERQLAAHRLYLETEWRQGHRANFASADLTGRVFSGLNLRGIKMDRTLLRGADFTRAGLQRANLIGAILEEARLDDADLSGARLGGANLVSARLENACLAKVEMEFALLAKAVLRGARLRGADMSGVLLDDAVLSQADLREANLRGAGLRGARLDEADLRDARLGGAFLAAASLRAADLRGAYLRLAKLDGADLSDADLRATDGLTQTQIDRAHCNGGTRLPLGLKGEK